MQVETLKRYRSGGEQTVRVEHVNVNAGGQAVVGNVSGRMGPRKKKNHPLEPHEKRMGELHSGRFILGEEKVTFEQLVVDLKNDYEVNGKRSWASVNYYLSHLRGCFGYDRAIDITPDRVRAYQSHRLAEGAANATVNREVATLGRMLSLGVDAGKLSRKPRFQMLAESNVRQGFLEHGDFLKLLSNLPEYLRPLVEFLYLSGWRKGEAVKLEWRDVDLNGKTVRLRIENSKNKEARILPLTGRLLGIIEERKSERRLNCTHVFHLKGRPIKEFRKTWRKACVAAGLAGSRNRPMANGRDTRALLYMISDVVPHETCHGPVCRKQ